MSHLGDDVRAQARVARRLAHELHDRANTTSRQAATTRWDSTAGDHFRTKMDTLTGQLHNCARDIDDLAHAIDVHADSVERAEEARDRVVTAMLAPVVAAPGMVAEAGHWVKENITGGHPVDRERDARTAGGWL